MLQKNNYLKDSTDFALQNISFEITSNKLYGIIGTTGSGKSSLLMALLREMPNIKGNINVNGKINYVSQEPWIFSATIRQNILFGRVYNKKKFNEIISACALTDVNKYEFGLKLTCVTYLHLYN